MTTDYRVIPLQQWPRKQHFEFYQHYEQPYFHIGCDLDAKHLYQYCKTTQVSFFTAYLFLLMKTVNQLEPFRLRIVEGQIRDYSDIAIECAILAKDDTVRFCHIPFADDFVRFERQLRSAKEQAINQPFMTDNFAAEQQRLNTLYMSVIPWISFTTFKHARVGKDESGIPRLVVGKMRSNDHTMPIGIDVHHALVDGLHVGQFVERLQYNFNTFGTQ